MDHSPLRPGADWLNLNDSNQAKAFRTLKIRASTEISTRGLGLHRLKKNANIETAERT